MTRAVGRSLIGWEEWNVWNKVAKERVLEGLVFLATYQIDLAYSVLTSPFTKSYPSYHLICSWHLDTAWDILAYKHLMESYRAALPYGTVYYAAQGGSKF